MADDIVKRIEKDMGLLDFQNENVMSSPVKALPCQPVTLKEALGYSGVVYLRGGLGGGRGPKPSTAPVNTHSYPSLMSLPIPSRNGRPLFKEAATEGPLNGTKVKLCRSEICCPWKGQVCHARPVVERPAAAIAPLAATPVAAAIAASAGNGAWSTPAATAAAIVGATSGQATAVKQATSAGSVWSNVMPIPPRLASAVVAGSGPKPKVVTQRTTEDINNNTVKVKGGSESSVSTKSKKRSLGRFNTPFEKVRIKKKGKANK